MVIRWGNKSETAVQCLVLCQKPYGRKNILAMKKIKSNCRTDPILIQMDGKNILVESGLGKGKLTENK